MTNDITHADGGNAVEEAPGPAVAGDDAPVVASEEAGDAGSTAPDGGKLGQPAETEGDAKEPLNPNT